MSSMFLKVFSNMGGSGPGERALAAPADKKEGPNE
jgi:hypothetical protein